MQIQLQNYFWLTNNNILQANQAPQVNLQSNKVILSAQQTQQFVSGHNVVPALQKIQMQTDGMTSIKVEDLKPGTSLAMYTFNWKFLSRSLQEIGITLQDQTKAEIVKSLETGNFTAISGIINQICKTSENLNSSKASSYGSNSVGISTRKKKPQQLSPMRSNSVTKIRQGNNKKQVPKFSKLDKSFDNYISASSRLHPNITRDLANQNKRTSVDFQVFQGDVQADQTNNCLQFLLSTICQVLDLRPKQAAGLLTNNNKFLAVVVMKGVKSDFRPIIKWYQQLYAQAHHATVLIERQDRGRGTALPSMLNTLRVGFHSRSSEVAEWTCKLFSRLGQQFLQAQLLGVAYQWLIDPKRQNPGGPGFQSLIQLLQRDNTLVDNISQVLLQFGQFNLNQLFSHHLLELCKGPAQYLKVTQILFPALASYKIAKDQILSSGLLQFWISFAIQRADNTTVRNTVNLRSFSITFLCDLWSMFPQLIQQNDDISNGIHTMLKRSSRDHSRLLKHITLTQLFRLLDVFTTERNPFAPIIYKTITFSLIQNHHESGIRQFILRNISNVFDTVPSIPVDILVIPFLKQIRVSEGITFTFKIFDFDFLTRVSRHPKLSIKAAIQAMDVLAKVYVEDVRVSMVALTPMMIMLSRFIGNQAMQEYIRELARLFVTRLGQLQKRQWVPSPPTKKKQLGGGGAPIPMLRGGGGAAIKAYTNPLKNIKSSVEQVTQIFDEAKLRRIRKNLILQLLRRIIGLQKIPINEQIKRLLLTANMKHKRTYNRDHKGIIIVMKTFGDPQSIILQFEVDYLQKMRHQGSNNNTIIQQIEGQGDFGRRLKDFEDNNSQMKGAIVGNRHIFPKPTQKINDHSKISSLGPNNTSVFEGRSIGDDFDRSVISQIPKLGALRGDRKLLVDDSGVKMYVPYQKKLTRMERKAMHQIEVIRLKKQARLEKMKLAEERRKLREQRVNQAAQRQLEKRRINQGRAPIEASRVGGFGVTGLNKSILYGKTSLNQTNVEMDPENLLATNKFAKILSKGNQIVIIDLNQQPKLEKQKVLKIFKKYSRLLKYILSKYSNTGYQVKRTNHLNSLPSEQLSTEKITLAQLTKLLKEHYFTNAMITRESLSTILKQLNGKYHSKADTSALNGMIEFQDFLFQVAIYVYTKPPKQLLNTSASACLKALLEQFEFATRAKGESTHFFEQAEGGGYGVDRDVIKELNKKLAADPSIRLPDGYQKVKEKEYVAVHEISPMLRIHPLKKMCIEILDDLLQKQFGFHLIEPITKTKQVYKAKKLNNGLKSGLTRNFSQRPNNLRLSQTTLGATKGLKLPKNKTVLAQMAADRRPQPKLSTLMKILVAEQPIGTRQKAKQVAEVLEDVLSAVSKGKIALYGRSYINKAGTKIQNQVVQNKRQIALQQQQSKLEKQLKVQQRRNQIGKQLQKLRADRQAKKKKQLQQKQKAESKQKRKQAKLAQIDLKIRKEFAQKREKRLQADKDKKKLQQQQKFQLNRKKKQQAFFLKQRQAQIQDQLTKMSQYNRAKKVSQLQESKTAKNDQKNQAVKKFYSKQKQKIEQSKKHQIDFLKLYNSPPIKQVFVAYNRPLKNLYTHYLLENGDSNAKAADPALKIGGWKKLGTHFQLSPKLVSSDDFIYIFKTVARRNQGASSQLAQALVQSAFHQALMRVATLGRYKLQGIPEPKRPVQQRESVSPQRSPSPPPPPPPKAVSPKPSGPSALAVENKKYIDSQRQALSLFIGGTGPLTQNVAKNNGLMGNKKAKFEFQQYEEMLNQVNQSFGQILQQKATFLQKFMNLANKKVNSNISRQVRLNPGSAVGMINDQISVEKQLNSGSKDMQNQLQKVIIDFAGLRKNITLKKKNPQNLKKIQNNHDDLVGKGEEVMEQLKKMEQDSFKRIETLENQIRQAKELESGKGVTGGLLRKKTEAAFKSTGLSSIKKSTTALLGKVPPPLKQPEFTTNGMNEKILEKMIREHMGIEQTDSKPKIEQKINDRK